MLLKGQEIFRNFFLDFKYLLILPSLSNFLLGVHRPVVCKSICSNDDRSILFGEWVFGYGYALNF